MHTCFLSSLLALSLLVNAHAVVDPSITLPWGTWRATKYNPDGDFFTFQNVRFGKTPVGQLRFNASVYPATLPDPTQIQDSQYGFTCHQLDTNACDCPPSSCPDEEKPEGPFLTTMVGPSHEDCLFLDMYVPAAALAKNISTPVIVWFHGGGFMFGAKDSRDEGLPLYNATGIMQAAAKAGTETIFIAANYRLGVFGWLAGPTMERDGVPNAGLYDQRLVLEFVQDFIHLVGGNKSKVSAWGESAGAGSIMHHLIAEDGMRDPLFRRAVMQSPGFQWHWDRSSKGLIEETYQNFTQLTDCATGGMECLRSQSGSFLAEKGQALFDLNKCTGRYVLGPAVDDRLIHQLPAVALAEGKWWSGMDSVIVSHVSDETGSFVPKFIQADDDVDRYIRYLIPYDNLTSVREAVAQQYKHGTAKDRTAAMIRDAYFTCNTRQLYEAYNETAGHHMMQYNFLAWLGAAVHASDLLPLFWHKDFDVGGFISNKFPLVPKILIDWIAEGFATYATEFQTYLLSHANHGDPNRVKQDNVPDWKNATANDALEAVMETQFSLIGTYFNADSVDKINSASICDFWTQVAYNITQPPRMNKTIEFENGQIRLGFEL